MHNQVRVTQPKVDTILLTKRGFPIFGCSLSSHLASFPLPSGIAYPIQLCVTRLGMLGLEEEGLFRLAAGSSKVKRLRAELEAGLSSLPSLETADHHVLTATIKSYLRELPDPLMGAELYQDWVEAGLLVRAGWHYHHTITTMHYYRKERLTGLMPSGTFSSMSSCPEKTIETSSTCLG